MILSDDGDRQTLRIPVLGRLLDLPSERGVDPVAASERADHQISSPNRNDLVAHPAPSFHLALAITPRSVRELPCEDEDITRPTERRGRVVERKIARSVLANDHAGVTADQRAKQCCQISLFRRINAAVLKRLSHTINHRVDRPLVMNVGMRLDPVSNNLSFVGGDDDSFIAKSGCAVEIDQVGDTLYKEDRMGLSKCNSTELRLCLDVTVIAFETTGTMRNFELRGNMYTDPEHEFAPIPYRLVTQAYDIEN